VSSRTAPSGPAAVSCNNDGFWVYPLLSISLHGVTYGRYHWLVVFMPSSVASQQNCRIVVLGLRAKFSCFNELPGMRARRAARGLSRSSLQNHARRRNSIESGNPFTFSYLRRILSRRLHFDWNRRSNSTSNTPCIHPPQKEGTPFTHLAKAAK
jgi:hypothetical protein